MLPTTVTEVQNGRTWIPAVNSSEERVKLPSKKILGTWVPLDEDVAVLEVNGELEHSKVRSWLNELGDSHTPLDNEDEVQIGIEDEGSRRLVIRLLRAYRGLMTNIGACPPATKVHVEHHIDTGDAAPIMLKRRRQAQTEDTVVEDNVKSMLSSGVIEEGTGALSEEENGEVRFCVDYRALNKITRKDVYPLPRIDEMLDTLGGALRFTKLDLRAGYWQVVRVAPKDKEKTAFTTKGGLYQFVRMPFGLTNAPSTFQRLMNSVLRGLTWITCLVYADDIAIYTRGGIEHHLVQLACVLQRLHVSEAGMTLKLKKCHFAMRSMDYLGHELSAESVRPLDRLINAVRDFPTPVDAKETRRDLYTSRNFGTLMAPLTKLLRKDGEFTWNEDQTRGFEQIKSILTTKPLLLYPDFSRPFRLFTDASVVGLGACWMQDHGSGYQPIAYASKVLSMTESKNGISELECLSVVWSIKLFRPYLYGRKFTIITDHAALKWHMSSPNLTGKLRRWALILQEMDFDIEYRPGNTNVVADALSSAPAAILTTTAFGESDAYAKSADTNRGRDDGDDVSGS
ncbi:Gag-pol fusion protein [Phytophthora megakarya]|uniref:Gag-pol fusion protein n=1 Tax=Phytophthora megakarya TaxID=4795 RepID=A0A225V524_9STRA|nr:Gag-pol fusion protein [Phytophthora megakarya]